MDQEIRCIETDLMNFIEDEEMNLTEEQYNRLVLLQGRIQNLLRLTIDWANY